MDNNNPNKKTIDEWSGYDQAEIESFGDEGDLSRQYILTPTILSLIGDPEGKKILDAGCGTGYLTRKLAKMGGILVGVEPSASMFEHCKEREEENLGINYLNEDLSQLSLEGEFDFVIANMVVQDIALYEAALKNLIEATAKGGTLIFSILHPIWDYTKNDKPYFENYEVKQNFGYSYHRTIQQYFEAIRNGGGRTVDIIEPQPLETAREVEEMKEEFQRPTFMFFVVEKVT